jgi:hypothetical protein
MHEAAKARSSAMAVSGLKLFLCADTYLPTAFAMSMRHDALARMTALSTNSAINAHPPELRVCGRCAASHEIGSRPCRTSP